VTREWITHNLTTAYQRSWPCFSVFLDLVSDATVNLFSLTLKSILDRKERRRRCTLCDKRNFGESCFVLPYADDRNRTNEVSDVVMSLTWPTTFGNNRTLGLPVMGWCRRWVGANVCDVVEYLWGCWTFVTLLGGLFSRYCFDSILVLRGWGAFAVGGV